MSLIPTVLAINTLTPVLKNKLNEATDINLAVSAFQRMALASDDLNIAINAMSYWFKDDFSVEQFNEKELTILKTSHQLTKPDLAGHAIASLSKILASPQSADCDKIAAEKILNERLSKDAEVGGGIGVKNNLIINLS